MSWPVIRDWTEDSLRGKSFWFRLLLLFWTFRVFLFVVNHQQVPGLWNPLWTASHGIHELGHWLTGAFGMWISISMGSVFQFLFPFVFVWGFLKHRDPHAAFLILTWQAASVMNMAQYAGSAENADLFLETPHYVTLYHDWVWMLSRLNARHWAPVIENLFWCLAVLFVLISAVGQIYCLAVIKKTQAQD